MIPAPASALPTLRSLPVAKGKSPQSSGRSSPRLRWRATESPLPACPAGESGPPQIAQILPQALQATQHEAGSPGRGEPATGEQPVIEDEAGQDPVGAGPPLGQGGKVGGSQIPAKTTSTR